jgi:hypothetical protein
LTPTSKFHPRLYLLAALLALNTALGVLAYDRGLPVLYIDEGYLYQEAASARGISPEARRYPGYPPLMLGLYGAAQALADVRDVHDTGALARAMRWLRLLTVVNQAVSLALVIALARRAGGWRAALVAGGAYVLLPGVRQWALVAQPEAWAAPWLLAAALLGWHVLARGSRPAAVGAVVAALVAVGFKYSFLPALGFGGLAALWQALHGTPGWRFVIAVQAGWVAGCGAALFAVFEAGALVAGGHAESSQFMQSGLDSLLAPERLGLIAAATARHLGLAPELWLVAAAAMLLIWLFVRSLRAPATAAVMLITMANVWFIATYLVFPDVTARYTSANSGLLVALWATGLVALASLLRGAAGLLLAGLVTAWLWLPAADTAARLRADVAGARGADAHLRDWLVTRVDGGVALEDETHWMLFHPVWGANTVPRLSIPLRDLAPGAANVAEVRFVVVTENTLPAEAPPWLTLDSMLLVKRYPNAYENRAQVLVTSTLDPGTANRDIHMLAIYQLVLPQTQADVVFGDRIRLVGYDLNGALRPGEALLWTPYWRALEPPLQHYLMFVHLTTSSDPTPLAQADIAPGGERFPTTEWRDPDEIIPGSTANLTIPLSAGPGDYVLRVGLYDPATGARLPVAGSQEGAWLIPLMLQQP